MSLVRRALSSFWVSLIKPPKGVEAVRGFDVNRYLGKWHEIARLDHSFERGLSKISAEYSRRPDGSIKVLNRGFNAKKNRWSQATGIARFTGSPSVASLRVSFFRPFWAGYHVIALDRENYGYALVCGGNRSYLWILARERALPAETKASLLSQAQAAGFDTSRLIWAE